MLCLEGGGMKGGKRREGGERVGERHSSRVEGYSRGGNRGGEEGGGKQEGVGSALEDVTRCGGGERVKRRRERR